MRIKLGARYVALYMHLNETSKQQISSENAIYYAIQPAPISSSCTVSPLSQYLSSLLSSVLKDSAKLIFKFPVAHV